MGAFQPFDSIGRLEIQSIGPSENRGGAEGGIRGLCADEGNWNRRGSRGKRGSYSEIMNWHVEHDDVIKGTWMRAGDGVE